MKEHSFPSKIDWVCLGAIALLALSGNRPIAEAQPQTSEIPVSSTPVPTEAPVYHPQMGPFPMAKRVLCRDTGAYNDTKLNVGCGQEKHQ
jgi:hypothetical protein